MSDTEDEGERSEEEGEQEVERVDLDYEELGEQGFKKIDYEIHLALSKAKTQPVSSEEEGEDEDAEQSEEEGGFDIESFVDDYNPYNLRNEKEVVDFKNRVKMINELGIYGGERDPDTNERTGKGHCIYSNKDEYLGGYMEGKKHGYGRYFFKSIKPEDVDIIVFSEYMKSSDEIKELCEKKHYVEAAKILKKILRKKKIDASLLRIRYVIESGPHPFYFGNWEEDLKTGNGIVKYRNGSFYKGGFAQDKRNGEGEMIYPNGDTYAGFWLNGKKHGTGEYSFRELNCTYVGLFENGQMKRGKWETSDGIVYDGKFKDNVIDSEGSFIFKNLGCKVEGMSYEKKWIPEKFVPL